MFKWESRELELAFLYLSVIVLERLVFSSSKEPFLNNLGADRERKLSSAVKNHCYSPYFVISLGKIINASIYVFYLAWDCKLMRYIDCSKYHLSNELYKKGRKAEEIIKIKRAKS